MPAYFDRKWRYRRIIKLPDGTTKTINGTPNLDSKKHAEQAEHDHVQREMQPKVKYAPVKYGDLWSDYVATYVRTNNKGSTGKAKADIYKHWLQRLSSTLISEIDFLIVEKLKQSMLDQGSSPKYVNGVLTVLQNSLNYAIDCSRLATLPKIKFLKTQKSGIKWMSEEHFSKVLQFLPMLNDDLAEQTTAALLLSFDAGLRPGEVLALKWADVAFGGSVFTVKRTDYKGAIQTTKGSKERTIKMTKRLKAALQAIHHAHEYVISKPNGDRFSHQTLNYRLRTLCQAAQLPTLSWHKLRHGFGTRLAERGATPFQIQNLLGHSSVQTSAVYIHVTEAKSNAAIDLLDDADEVSSAPKKEETQPSFNAPKALKKTLLKLVP